MSDSLAVLLSRIAEKVAATTGGERALEELETVLHTPASVPEGVHKLAAEALEQALDALQPGDVVHVATTLGPVDGVYAGDQGLLSDACLDPQPDGTRLYRLASRAPRTLVLAVPGHEGGVLALDGTLHPEWVTLPRESVRGVVKEEQDGA